ncbi:isocitrate lyase/PEP mutase family protein [Hydrogenophaga sp.]|jgi:2-methylisocitrate lyase-like PEP mutase family enzyme|uniref:isocitrate lyase/PEP mutase family protein n=1 Tax=Hydrogenophaga sp. TaxID=1904254 RepID=UPI003F6EB6AC
MNATTERAERLVELHRAGCFVIPNPWDRGSAVLLAGMGFPALASSSAGQAYSLGLPDGDLGRERTFSHLRDLVDAIDLPLSADLENGFGDEPSDCADTIRAVAALGVVGGSIEDATGRPEDPIYGFDASVTRVRAAVQAARSLPFPFTLTARAENLLWGRHDLDDTVRRLQAYAEVGADVLYAPGLKTAEEVERVVRAVAPKPVNVLMGLAAGALDRDTLQRLGVRRISVGSSLARAAYHAMLEAAREMAGPGQFTYASHVPGLAAFNAMFRA